MPETILVAMSGGVDSSTVAAMLLREGHLVIGMTMQLWNQRRLPEIATENAHRTLLLARRRLRCPSRSWTTRHSLLRRKFRKAI